MLGKLLKYDLKKNMRWLWILFVSPLVLAGASRGFAELGKNIAFFKVVGIFFDSVFYALLANVLIHPFLRSFLNFTKSIYGDESYLTHTLPVTKSQIINSKFITAFVEMVLGFVSIVLSLLIRFASPAFFKTLKLLLSTLIVGNISLFAVLSLVVVLILVEFLMYIAIIFFSIIVAYRAKDKKALKAFLLTALMAFIAITVLAIIMAIVLLINGIELSAATLTFSAKMFNCMVLTGIIVYSLVIVLFYFLAKREFNKGVNVD